MDKIRLLETLKSYPMFTLNEFVRITGKDAPYTRLLLHRLRKENLIYQIERGKYTLHDDPLIFASYLQLPSYISFWTALRFYNFTEQLPKEITLASPRPKNEILFQGTKIRFIKMKHFFGYRKEIYRGFEIFIAEKEKAVIDSLLEPVVPIDEVLNAIKSKELDEKVLIDHAISTNNKSLIKRLGYLMELSGHKADELLDQIDSNYIPLDSNFSKKGERDRRWKIIINRKL